MNTQDAYELGVKLAMQDAGLIKTSAEDGKDEPGSAVWPAIFGTLGGGLAAQKGRGWSAAATTLAGDTIGMGAGSLGGAGLGALISAASKGKIGPREAVLLGGVGGGLTGKVLGRIKGYRLATGE